MSDVLISEEYIFVIDCDRYAGPFADALCAYCTGFMGEAAGDYAAEMADLYYTDQGIEDDEGPHGELADDKNPLNDLIADQQDDAGNWMPCAVWPSRTYGMNAEGKSAKLDDKNFNNYNFPAGFSVGIFMYSKPSAWQYKTIRERAEKFFKEVWPKLRDGEKVGIEGYRLIQHRKTAQELSI